MSRSKWAAGVGLGAGIATFPLCCLGAVVGTIWALPAMGLLALAAVWLSMRASGWRQDAQAALWNRDAAVIDEFGWGDGWLVDLLVLQGDAPTGSDRGMLWVEDGRLIFSGRRTSFALGGAEVQGRCRQVAPLPGLRHNLVLRMRSRTPAGLVGISVTPVVRAKWQSGSAPGDVWEAVERWRLASPNTEGGLPPLALGPGTRSPGSLLRGALSAVALWFLLIGGLGASLLFEQFFAVPWIFIGAMLVLAWPGAPEPMTSWRAWRDRRRIADRSISDRGETIRDPEEP